MLGMPTARGNPTRDPGLAVDGTNLHGFEALEYLLFTEIR